MANSLTFNGTALSTYGLAVTSHGLSVAQDAIAIRIQDKAYAWRSSLAPKIISLGVDVKASSLANLKSYLDSIKTILNTREDAQLILDMFSDRYWLARFESLNGNLNGRVGWSGDLNFIAHDPLAYSTGDAITTLHNLNTTDPQTVTETPEGTANTNPVYTLLAGSALGAIEVTLENLTTSPELALVWSGTIAEDDELEIDVANKLVSLNDTPSMATVTGRFPYLQPGANSIKVTSWGTAGTNTITIVYRNRYL